MSPVALDVLCAEFERTCCLLYHGKGEDGNWHATIESDALENLSAADDIQKMLNVLPALPTDAKEQWDGCLSRDLNIGFDCGDTWAYPHSLPHDVVRLVADSGCTLSLTLYPIRDEDEPDV